MELLDKDSEKVLKKLINYHYGVNKDSSFQIASIKTQNAAESLDFLIENKFIQQFQDSNVALTKKGLTYFAAKRGYKRKAWFEHFWLSFFSTFVSGIAVGVILSPVINALVKLILQPLK
ncbi:hypothetical protein RCG39_05030 [Lactococcus petauri]|uniref:hypothetical protein n=1 Tax=Lactococcus TaxID=1357 RepID=UPI0020731C24|nr:MULTISPECIES: hypothetical protein [Lactococcus]MCM6847624.1 hypothetical protein [Lactococcus lactis]MDQ7119751.1 hypothetical protein [Lactococcus petauri]MDQ7125388.1 hypothetical protein [Lactococcus petauri]MDQ7126367.1 hypothetical protein [Lactococcus petauri]MDQ7128274.1 hypothetical protein [Lactococcus petauri]